MVLGIDDSAMERIGGEALDAELSVEVAIAEADEGVAGGFDGDDAGELAQFVLDAGGAGFHEADAEVLALDDVPLEVEDFIDGVPEAIGDDEDSCGEGEAGYREEGLDGFPFEVSDGDPERIGEEVGDAGAFDEGGSVIGRGFGAHGFGGWELGGAADGAEDADGGGAGAGEEGEGEGGLVEHEVEFGEAEEAVVEVDELVAEEDTADGSEDRAGGDHGEGELEVMADDVAVRVAEGLEDGDLFALEGEEAGEHGIGHEGGDAEEDDGEADGESGEDLDFVGDADMGGVVFTSVGATSAVGGEELVEFGDDGAF
ncbi:MAG: hypothetical protein RI897_1976 [Verrucomicrobiota bacterium]